MGNQGWLHRSCGLRARRKRSRGQAERADGKPECGELYRGGPRLSGPIHRRFSLFAQKNSEVGAATPTSKRVIPASSPLFTLIGRRTSADRPGWRAAGGPATTHGRAPFISYIAIVGAAATLWRPPDDLPGCYLHRAAWASLLHVGIVGARAALRRCPDDVLARILDVAGLAVDAVGRVDLQAGQAL
ncbi:hypothetical protein SAMN05878295_101176 [Aeromonas hydrophila]|nr:hypothetical protein SAMN05878295_101176 [Aeromonas hydrophila]SIQ40950.1 hypothetical protein SAMN05880569_10277 [Aeromonas hydrophila]